MKLDNLGLVTEEGARRLLAEGYHAEVECRSSARPVQNGGWAGLWIVHLVNADSGDRRTIVTLRLARSASGTINYREFKTVNGVVSFIGGLGIRVVSVPLDEGGIGRNALAAPETPTGA